jgi:hypothetical protein
MKLLLVLGSDETAGLISIYLAPLGFELVRYRHVLKAMDNVDEIDPQAIIISARDFPRHWKVLVQYVRSQRPKEICPIIILKGDNFPLEESSKGFFLGISGIVSESLQDHAELDRLQRILSRYVPVNEKRRAHRYHTEDWNQFGFLISNPVTNNIIAGEVKTISSSGISFTPAHSSQMKDITLDMDIDSCSLRAGSSILSPVCRLVRTGHIVSFKFISFPGDEQKTLNQYLDSIPLQKHKLSAN